jgi:hypothetical protein
VVATLVLLSCGGSTDDKRAGSGGEHGTPDASAAATGTGGSLGAGTGGGSTCAPGGERCACYGNGTCDAGLTCASNLCVALAPPQGSGGTAGTGGKGVGGTLGSGGKFGLGGTLGSGGTLGTGGAPASGGTLGTGGAPATGGTLGSGGAPATGGTLGTGGAPASGGAGGAHQCYPDQTLCTDDTAGCCLGLRCVSEPSGPNAVCTPTCQTGGDCASGCCSPLANNSANVCLPPQYCPDTCIPEYVSCISAMDACCAGTMCIYDDTSQSTASCSYICTFDGDCLSGCCASLQDGTGLSVCANASYCAPS